MRHGSLFSGIGGFDLAAQWMGWENVFHCEWNEFGKRVLSYYWPNAISYNDITKTDFTIHRGGIDILTGGFPCQPYSMAGKRKGKADERHLWPEMLRAIREIQPRWVVGENVLGLTNWNGGLVFEEVQADLEAEGYEVQPYVLPACAVNAPHRRDRVWFVAKNTMRSGWAHREAEQERTTVRQFRDIGTGSANGVCLPEGVTPDTEHNGHVATKRGRSNEADSQWGAERQDSAEQLERIRQSEKLGSLYATPYANESGRTKQHGTSEPGRTGHASGHGGGNWHDFPTQPTIRSGNDGFSAQLDGITFPKWRNESIKAAGNAIVPQVAYQIFKTIEAYEQR